MLTPSINGTALPTTTSTGNIDWACASAVNATATAQGLAVGTAGSILTKYVPTNCK